VPEHPDPPDRPHAADRALQPPDKAAQHGHPDAWPLPRQPVAYVEVEDHHANRLAARAPHVAEVRESDGKVDGAGGGVAAACYSFDQADQDGEEYEVDQPADQPQTGLGEVSRHRHRTPSWRRRRPTLEWRGRLVVDGCRLLCGPL